VPESELDRVYCCLIVEQAITSIDVAAGAAFIDLAGPLPYTAPSAKYRQLPSEPVP